MDIPSIIDPFHKSLYVVIIDEIQKRSETLASGLAKSHEDYREKVGYLNGLKDALRMCHQVEETTYGSKGREE
jgi:hypothetical protein